jgi:hypothetical protein
MIFAADAVILSQVLQVIFFYSIDAFHTLHTLKNEVVLDQDFSEARLLTCPFHCTTFANLAFRAKQSHMIK